ncbi:hypothetical protein E3U23_13430 [Erythrobacter litoralis]|uniref:hypothetical protein n=1 Tax=Erythrobacter litoralis TaxID=39960 RepID=UPI002434A08C|nr:hypothetical protein [Erythrobacter litoralis]MDG6080191.1 hypothetical protein [Erythrobacter litoralis]
MGDPDRADWYPVAIPLLLWTVLPIAILCLQPYRPRASGIGAGISAMIGALIYLATAWSSTGDPLDGLVFMMLPVMQLGFALLWLGGVALYYRLIDRKI